MSKMTEMSSEATANYHEELDLQEEARVRLFLGTIIERLVRFIVRTFDNSERVMRRVSVFRSADDTSYRMETETLYDPRNESFRLLTTVRQIDSRDKTDLRTALWLIETATDEISQAEDETDQDLADALSKARNILQLRIVQEGLIDDD